MRQVRRAPGFAAAAILTLALGIGANTAIFSIINGFFRPLPVPEPDRIVILSAVLPGDETGLRYRLSFPALKEFRTATDVFSEVFGFFVRLGGLTVDGKTTQFVHQSVTGNFFTGLGLTPAAGRLFHPGEGEDQTSETVIVLGHSYWLKQFGGDPSIVGKNVRFDGVAARIVGVAPAGFRGMFEGADMDGYLSIGGTRWIVGAPRVLTDRSLRLMTVVARLAPGVSVERAQAAADVIARDLAAAYPATDGRIAVRVVPETRARPVPMPFLASLMPTVRALMFTLASLVLLIACMNVVNLLLVRATSRQREMATRVALGAGRWRLLRLLLVESLLLSLLGALGGVVFGSWASSLFTGSLDVAMEIPLHLDFHFDWSVFGYALALACVTGIGVGLLPALGASRAQVTELLHDGGRGGSAGGRRQRARSLLVVAQVAGSVILLIVAGLFVRTLRQAQRLDLGFDPQQVLIARLDPHQIGYDEARSTTFFDELDRRLRELPGVESNSMSFSVPLGWIFVSSVVVPEGVIASADEPGTSIGRNVVSPTYFDTMRIPIVRGRAFTDLDIPGSLPATIVNETLAGRLWPNQDPIGKRFQVDETGELMWQVVGVARDSKYMAVFEGALPHFYLPIAQLPSFLRNLQIRSTLPPEVLAARVREQVAQLEPDMPIADVRPLTDALAGNIGFLLFRVGAVQAASLGMLGLVLAVIGVYGVVSFRAAQRAREIGIRLALGAQPSDVRTMVLRQGAVLVLAGMALGLGAMLALSRLIAGLVVMVSVTDPLTFAAVTTLLAVTALAACYIPARRAMRVDPAVALRHE